MNRMYSLVPAEVYRAILGLVRRIASPDGVSSLLDVGCWDRSEWPWMAYAQVPQATTWAGGTA